MTELGVRFWSKVERSAACWEWRGGLSGDGYGAFGIDHRTYRAHRLSYEATVGPIPPGRMVLHRCDNRRCVRPSHLYLGDAGDNARDAVSRGRMTPPVYFGEEWAAVHGRRSAS